MKDNQGNDSEERGVRFVPVMGSVIGGMGKEKVARITDAMADLQLGIDGLRSQLPSVCDGDRFAHALGTGPVPAATVLRNPRKADTLPALKERECQRTVHPPVYARNPASAMG